MQRSALATERLVIRPVVESDRGLFVRLLTDPAFMVFSERGALDEGAASTRFDHMMELGQLLPVAKQAVVDQVTGEIVGYVGADHFWFRGVQRLEFGYRFIVRARGLGYATEASKALLAVAWDDPVEELLAIIAPENLGSKRVAEKVGFSFSEGVMEMGYPMEIWTFTGWARRPA